MLMTHGGLGITLRQYRARRVLVLQSIWLTLCHIRPARLTCESSFTLTCLLVPFFGTLTAEAHHTLLFVELVLAANSVRHLVEVAFSRSLEELAAFAVLARLLSTLALLHARIVERHAPLLTMTVYTHGCLVGPRLYQTFVYQ